MYYNKIIILYIIILHYWDISVTDIFKHHDLGLYWKSNNVKERPLVCEDNERRIKQIRSYVI